MESLLRTRVTAVWALLVAATLVSWALGSDHGLDLGSQRLASAVVLVIAFVKVRFIGLYFMEVRDAPVLLRGALEAYCLVVCAVVVGLFLWA